MFDVTFPAALWLLPLAVLCLLRPGQQQVVYSSLEIIPRDPLSGVIDIGLRVIGAAAVIAIVLGLSGFSRAEQNIERIGTGAQTVILLDSSGSMDRFFANDKSNARVGVWGTYSSKGQIARQLIGKFAAERHQDLFALYVFSGNPIPVLPLTEKQDIIQAAIAAGAIERGLASTDLGAGLIRALEFFEDKPFAGSRIMMLVSDGAARLTIPTQERITNLMKKHRVTLYWIYLRTQFSPGLSTEMGADLASQIAPEQLVHKFFSQMGQPYRAFPAENPKALGEAIAAVDKLQKLPIRYTDVIPGRDLSAWCYGIAIVLLFILAAAKLSEVRQW